MIAFLHTSKIHINRFENLVRKFDKKINVKHYVNNDLLVYALKNNSLHKDGFEKELLTIKSDAPQLIICTCSTYGEECDKRNDVERIDLPIANFLVKNYKKIGIAFTVNTTKKISEEMLINEAKLINKTIEIVSIDCSSSWKYFENDEFDNYELTIANKINTLASQVDVIFLAQASMEDAKKHLINLNKEVFSSPEFGVKSYLNKLKTTKLW